MIENWAMTWMRTPRFGLGAVITGLVALALLAHGYRVDNRERAAQRDAEAHGVVVPAVVEVALGGNEQNRTDVQVDIQGVKRATKVFGPDHPLIRGMAVRVAWAPADPTRIYIVGERPWTWWAAMRPLFATIAFVSLLLALTGLLWNFALARE